MSKRKARAPPPADVKRAAAELPRARRARGEWNVEGLLLPVDAASPRGAWKTPLPIHMIRSRPISPFGFE